MSTIHLQSVCVVTSVSSVSLASACACVCVLSVVSTWSNPESATTRPLGARAMSVWYTSVVMSVLAMLLLPVGTYGVVLYSLIGWCVLSVVILACSVIHLPLPTYPSGIRSVLYSDLLPVCTVLGVVNACGSYLYISVYLTIRMWLVFALHGFCTGCISVLMDSVNCTIPLVGVVVLVVVGICTVSYVLIQTYVYLCFLLMYQQSDILAYYQLVTVSLAALVQSGAHLVSSWMLVVLLGASLYLSAPSGRPVDLPVGLLERTSVLRSSSSSNRPDRSED